MVRMLPSSSIMPSPPGFLVLRVQGSARDGQLVRLQSPKCTIGSGPNCTLRLRADNIGAVHCLILRGPSRTLVRRWLPDTRLNGRNFSESVLQAGDRLSIGAIDLEVVETAQAGLPSEDLRDRQQAIDRQLVQIEARLRSLDEQQAECDAKEADFQARRSELDTCRARWESQQAQSRKQWEAREAEFEASKAELQSREATFNTLKDEFQAREAEFKTRKAELQAREAAFEALKDELQYANALVDDERRAWETERFETEARQTAKAEQLAALQEEFQRQKAAFRGVPERVGIAKSPLAGGPGGPSSRTGGNASRRGP